MKQRHRLQVALGASAALTVGAGLALASVPTPQPDRQSATHYPVSATYATASAELDRLRAQLTGSAQDTALLQSVIVRLQHQVDVAQARLEQLTRLRHHGATPTAVPANPTKPTQPTRTRTSTNSHHSPTAPPPTTTPSDDDGSGDD